MKLIVGLGNPGIKFKNTRHNAGVRVIESWQKSQQLNDFVLNKKLGAKISENHDFIIAAPEVFMNESGRVVKKTMKRFGIARKNLLVVHDDSDLVVGSYKLQFNRGAAGHKGVSSIINHIASQEFWRLRIGIRPPNIDSRPKAGSFVLKSFNSAEKAMLKLMLPAIEKSGKEWLSQ